MGENILKNVDDTTKVFTAILILGLTGLLFLIVFGNLTDNLGFTDISSTTNNESGFGINATVFSFSTASDDTFQSLSVDTALNATSGLVILSGNFTVDSTAGTIVGSVGRTNNFSNVTITYVTNFQSQGEVDTNNVITNLSGGAVTFFSFSNVWFTLLAVVLLIIIVMSVIAVVQRNKRSEFSS